jgi:hypothetical protein
MMEINKTKDTVLNGIVRHVLTAAGGALVARAAPEWARDALRTINELEERIEASQ